MSSSQGAHVYLVHPRGPDNIVRCYKHALPARKLTSHTLLNPNRNFWKCDLDKPEGCSFFFWDDEACGSRSPSQHQQRQSSSPPSSSAPPSTYPHSSQTPSHLSPCPESVPHIRMAPKPESPITPIRTPGGKPATPVSRTRIVPKLRKQRLDAIQAALDAADHLEAGSSSAPSDDSNKLPSIFPDTALRNTSAKTKPSAFKPVPVAPFRTPRTQPDSAASSTSSPGPSVVKTELLDSDAIASFFDTTESEEELWMNTRTPRVPYTDTVRPGLRGTAGQKATSSSHEDSNLPSASRAQTSAATKPAPVTPPSAVKGKSQAQTASTSSDDEFSVPSDFSLPPSSPDKRKRTATTASRPTVEDVTDIDDAPPSPPKRHRGLATPPTSSPVRPAPDEDKDAVPPVPGAFDFERERTRSVSPLAGREKGKEGRRPGNHTPPSKAGVRFTLPTEDQPVYPNLPGTSLPRPNTSGSSSRVRPGSRSADESPTGMSANLIADLAIRMSERSGALSGDALKLKSLEIYVRGLETKLALSQEQQRVKDAEIMRLRDRFRDMEVDI